MKKISFIEIDIPYCANTYGVLPCTASLSSSPPTGTRKCFNTIKTCQDIVNYIDDPVTLRFSEDVGNPPKGIDALPIIQNISYTPAVLSLGKNLGTRASVTVTFKTIPWSDIGEGYDKYYAERPYDPKKQGDYWSKFRARQPYLRGKKLRLIRGSDDQTLEQMETRHYVIDSFNHNAANGTFSITAKDLLKFADDDRSQAPSLSNGFLLNDVTADATTIPLVPFGVGAEYPESGYAAIGGKEIVSYAHELVPGNDADTVLLIHSSGANGITVFTDTSSVPKAITTVGNTVVNDIFKKFDIGGIFFDGGGDSLTLADNAAWEFGSGDFAIDFWQVFRTLAATKHFFTHYTDANNRYFLSVTTTGVLTFSVVVAGVTTVTMSSAAGVVADDDVIRHIAVNRTGNVWRIFVNGVQVATTTDSDAIPNFTSLFRIGGDNANGSSYDGWMFEFRVSKGVSRWNANFTPPIVAYQTSIDTFIIERAQLNTEASEHEANDRVQLVLIYDAQDAADIIRDLFVNYAGIDDAAIPIDNWRLETENFLSRLFSAIIAEPTGVNKLVSELIEDGALCVWWDDVEEQIRLRVLRTVPLDALQFDENNYLMGSFSTQEQPNQRVSQIWRYFAKRNPLLGQDDPDNYRSVVATVNLEAETNYGSSIIHKIFSRWIPFGGRAIAEKANELYLSRFRDPPRRLNFSTFNIDNVDIPVLGQSYRIAGLGLQDDTGEKIYVPAQITRLKPDLTKFDVEAEEMLIVNVDLTNRIIAIDVTTYNINLRDLHDSLYPEVTDQDVIDGVNLLCTIDPNVIVGSLDADLPSFDVGDWPVGFPIVLRVAGRIAGAGGKGNAYTGAPSANGQKGGTALYTRKDIDLEVADGQIWAGGGGGGRGSSSFIISPNVSIRPGSGGGGGAGFVPGSGGIPASLNYNGTVYQGMAGNPGTQTAGGTGGTDYFFGGNGGGRGVAGTAGQSGGGSSAAGAGGAAGNAIDGVSFVNVVTGPGDIIGPQIN